MERSKQIRPQSPGTIVCDNCGGAFDANLPACPYCGTTYEIPAERVYQQKLQNMRRDISGMQSVSKETVHGAAGHLFRRVAVIAVVVGLIALAGFLISSHARKKETEERNAEYTWHAANDPIMNEYYENGRYDELVEFYWNASSEGHSMYNWPHQTFVQVLSDLMTAEHMLRMEADGESLLPSETENLVYYEICTYGIPYKEPLTDADIAYLTERAAPLQEDLAARIGLSSEEISELTSYMKRHNGYPDYDKVEALIKEKL